MYRQDFYWQNPGFPGYQSGQGDHTCGGVLLQPLTGPAATELPAATKDKIVAMYQFVLTSASCANERSYPMVVIGAMTTAYNYPRFGAGAPLWPNTNDGNPNTLKFGQFR